MVAWLSWPWRAACRALLRAAAAMPYPAARMLLMPVVFTVAIVQTAQADAPPEQLVPVLALLITLVLGIFVYPALDTAIARPASTPPTASRPNMVPAPTWPPPCATSPPAGTAGDSVSSAPPTPQPRGGCSDWPQPKPQPVPKGAYPASIGQAVNGPRGARGVGPSRAEPCRECRYASGYQATIPSRLGPLDRRRRPISSSR